MCIFDLIERYSSFFQALGAIATAIISIFVYFQNRKIKTLTDVVEELRKQTEQQEFSSKILAKQYLSKAPSFSFLGGVRRKEDVYLIKLCNSDVKIKSVYPIGHEGLLCRCDKIGQLLHVGDEIEIYFTPEFTKDFNKGDVFSFFLELEDGVRDTFFQNFIAKCLKDYKSSSLHVYIDCEIRFDAPRPDMTTTNN